MTARWLAAVACGVCAAVVVSPAGAGTQPTILIDDIDRMTAEVFCGNAAVRDFLQGPKLEGGAAGIVVFDSKGVAYVACRTFIEVVAGGQARILTGVPGTSGWTDGPPGAATFGDVEDIAIANDRLLYVADGANSLVRKIERKDDGVWHTETVAGVAGQSGHRDGPGRQALFTHPMESIAVDENGVVYVLDGDWLRKIEKGVVTTLNAGTGYQNGPLGQALISRGMAGRHALTYDGQGNLYIADKMNMDIRKVDLKAGWVSTVAGCLPGVPHDRPRDGPALDARFHPGGGPVTVFYNPKDQNLLVRSDDDGDRIRWIAGGQMKTFGPDPAKQRTAVTGPWRDCVGGAPCGVDREGNVYIIGSRVIRRVSRTPMGADRTALPPAAAPALSRGEGRGEGAASGRPAAPGRLMAVAPRLSMSAAMSLPGGAVPQQGQPAVAYGQGVYLVVWREGSNGLGGKSDILGLRFDDEGQPLDQAPIAVCTDAGVQDSPAAAFCDGQFLVAWSDFRNGKDYDVYATLVDPKGRVRTPNGALVAGGAGGQANPAVAANEKDTFVVVWQDYRVEDHFGVYGARVAADSGAVADREGFLVMKSGEKPVLTFLDPDYVVAQKGYAAVLGPDGKVKVEAKSLWTTKVILLPAIARAWGKALVFFNTEPDHDPWGWGGNGAIIGVTVGPDGRSPEDGWITNLRDLSGLKADGRVRNCLDAARWRGQAAWPMGMPGGFKGTADGMWPTGRVAAAFNGRSVLAVWCKAHWVDKRRVTNRDLYLRRVLDGWGYYDEYPIPLVTGTTEETFPVLAAGKPGDVLLAYERVLPEGGVGIECRLLVEQADEQPPRVAWTAPEAANKLVVAFDEPVDPASAAVAANYAIDGLAVKSAVVVDDNRAQGRQVLLETDPQTPGKTYVLRVKGVKDRSAAANVAAGEPVQYLAKPGAFTRSPFVPQWAVLGPFPNDWGIPYIDTRTAHPSPGDKVPGRSAEEGKAILQQSLTVKQWETDGWGARWTPLLGVEQTWKAVASVSGVCDFGRALGPYTRPIGEEYPTFPATTGYANVYVFSDRERDILVHIDSTDGHRALLNGDAISFDPTGTGQARGFHEYVVVAPGRLVKGWNQLLVQVENKLGSWCLSVQLTDRAGHPVPDLTYQVEDPFKK
jgi:hypothetical protein